jgi:hypothetical protein
MPITSKALRNRSQDLDGRWPLLGNRAGSVAAGGRVPFLLSGLN